MKKCLVMIIAVLLVSLLSACSPLQAMTEEIKKELADIASLPQVIVEEDAVPEKSGSDEEGTAIQIAPQEDHQTSEQDVYEKWSKVVGYWNAAEGYFAVPDMEDNHTAVFRYGMWETEGRDYGRVTALLATGQEELEAEVVFPSAEATELRDALEEETITVRIDYSGLEQDGKIRIKIGEDAWYQYMFAGDTQEEAYQTYLDNTQHH